MPIFFYILGGLQLAAAVVLFFTLHVPLAFGAFVSACILLAVGKGLELLTACERHLSALREALADAPARAARAQQDETSWRRTARPEPDLSGPPLAAIR